MSAEVTSGWPSVRLDHAAELCLGKMLDKEKNKGEPRPYLANVNVRWGSFELQDLREMRFEEREFERYGLRFGDIVMCEGGEPGRCAIWTDEVPGMMIQKALHRIRPREGVDSHYLCYVLTHGVQSGSFDEYMTGSGIRHLPGNQVAKLEVLMPSLQEQRRIAEVLRSMDEAIATAHDAARHARVLQSLVTTDRCFGHDFDMIRLGDILTDIRYGTSVKCDASEADGHPVLRIPNVVNGRVEQDDLKYAMVSDADLRRFSLQTNDVVVVRTNGNPAYIGRSALIDDSASQFLFASYLIRMRFNCLRAWPPYVYATLNSGPIREKLLEAATTSAGNYNINTASLKDISIPLPSLEMQHQISGIIHAVTEAAIACENAAESSRRAKADLVSDLLSGRVRVPA